MPNRPHLFSDLRSSDNDVLTEHGTIRSYPANSILINEGDDTDSLYVVMEGEVKAYASDENGKEVILNMLGPGEYFGELALVDSEPRSASVKTMEPTKVMVIGKHDFKKALAENPDMAYNMIQSLSRQVRELTNNVKSLALMDVYGRVAHTLLDLATELEDGKMVIEQKLTHQDIADMVGASREMVSRILKDLVNGGYISIKSKIVTINERLPAGW